MSLTIEEMQRILVEAFPGNEVPVVREANERTVTLCHPISDRHGRPGGTVSGPTLMMLADTAAWLAILYRIGPVLLAVTTSLHIDFLRKPALADVCARARLLKLGQRLAVGDVEIYSEGSVDLAAKAQVTYSIPPRPRSDGE